MGRVGAQEGQPTPQVLHELLHLFFRFCWFLDEWVRRGGDDGRGEGEREREGEGGREGRERGEGGSIRSGQRGDARRSSEASSCSLTFQDSRDDGEEGGARDERRKGELAEEKEEAVGGQIQWRVRKTGEGWGGVPWSH